MFDSLPCDKGHPSFLGRARKHISFEEMFIISVLLSLDALVSGLLVSVKSVCVFKVANSLVLSF